MVSDELRHVYVILNAKSDELPMGRLQFSFALEPGLAKFVTLRKKLRLKTNSRQTTKGFIAQHVSEYSLGDINNIFS